MDAYIVILSYSNKHRSAIVGFAWGNQPSPPCLITSKVKYHPLLNIIHLLKL